MSWGSNNSKHGSYCFCTSCYSKKKQGINCCPPPNCVSHCASSCYEAIIYQPLVTEINSPVTPTFGGGNIILTFASGTNGWNGGGNYKTNLPTGTFVANSTNGNLNYINTQALGTPPSFTSHIVATGTDGNLTLNSQFSGNGTLTTEFSGCDASLYGGITVLGNNYSTTLSIQGNGSITQFGGFPTLTISNVKLVGNFAPS